MVCEKMNDKQLQISFRVPFITITISLVLLKNCQKEKITINLSLHITYILTIAKGLKTRTGFNKISLSTHPEWTPLYIIRPILNLGQRDKKKKSRRNVEGETRGEFKLLRSSSSWRIREGNSRGSACPRLVSPQFVPANEKFSPTRFIRRSLVKIVDEPRLGREKLSPRKTKVSRGPGCRDFHERLFNSIRAGRNAIPPPVVVWVLDSNYRVNFFIYSPLAGI